MKKITLIVIASVFSLTSLNAQMEQGKMLVGLSTALNLGGSSSGVMGFGYSTIKYKSDADNFNYPEPANRLSFNLSPKMGFFVIDNLAIGLDVSFSYSKFNSDEVDYTYKESMYCIGPFVRYYIPTTLVKPFFEIGATFGTYKEKTDGNSQNSEYENSLITYGTGFGIAIPIGKKASFDMMLGYNSILEKAKEDNDDNYRTEANTIGLRLGFVVLLGK